MWLSGQQKRPVECGEGQVGVVTMSEGDTAVLLDCERRGLQIFSPGGYTWTPRVNGKVLVIQGRGEIPCIAGALQGSQAPERVEIKAEKLNLEGRTVTIKAPVEQIFETKDLHLEAQVYVKEEKLENLIARIVMLILTGQWTGV